jgi:succinate dehydrogenase/fumarate reductase-like Fe-S protein
LAKRKIDKWTKMIYKILHKKLKIKEYEPQENPDVTTYASEELAVPVPNLTCVVLFLLQTREVDSPLEFNQTCKNTAENPIL